MKTRRGASEHSDTQETRPQVGDALAAAVRGMESGVALPRRNGELVFEAPWQGRAFGMALAVVQHLELDWSEFQQRLIAAIGAASDAPYYERWLTALETLVVDHKVVSATELVQASERLRRGDS